ncbi:MAG: hypothetical protein E7040_08315 [Lentisphaerae bacterium]|nr:hypothetical protein [Lentisphaerota bacterium]
MKMRCKISVFAVMCGFLLLATGCGYHIGVRGMMHPQIKSVAIAPVQNNTLEPLAADHLRMQLAGEFQSDGALKLKRVSNADCVVYAVITSVTNRSIEDASFDGGITYRPEKFRLTVKVNFKVVIPGSGTMLVKNGKAVGHGDYSILADPAVARASALKYACYQAAKDIVSQTTEAW